MGLSATISSLLATTIVQLVKTNKPDDVTDEEKKRRGRILKAVSTFVSIVLTVAGAYFLGEGIDVANLEGQLETLTTAVMAIIGPQGWYKMAK